jgi:hypothetical protein
MLRKVSVLAAAIAIPLSVISNAGGAASASETTPPPVNTTNYTVSCSTFSGSVKFNPAARSQVGPFTGNVKGKVDGCTAEPTDGGTPVDIVSGEVTGPITFELNTDQGDCNVFVGTGSAPDVYPVDGTLTVVWRTANRTPAFSSGDSVVQLANVVTQSESQVSLTAPGSPGGVSGTGSFTGADGGASDSLAFDGESSATVFSQCFRPSGMRRLTFGNMPLDLG